MTHCFYVFALLFTFFISSYCDIQSFIANQNANVMSDSLSSMIDELLAELKNPIVVSAKESNVDRTEKEADFLFNQTQTKMICIKGWTKYQNKCIKVFNERVVYPVAENICKYSGATIFSLHSVEEIEFVLKLVLEIRPTFYIEEGSIWTEAKTTNSGVNRIKLDDTKILNNSFSDEPYDLGKYVGIFYDSSTGAFISKEDNGTVYKALFACEKDPIEELENKSFDKLDILEKRIKDLEEQVSVNRNLLIVNERKFDISKERLLEYVVPIGFIYIQLTLQQTPQTIWPNCSWSDISAEYSGLFFRPLSGNSSRLEVNRYPVWLDLIVSGSKVRPRNQAIRIWKRIQ